MLFEQNIASNVTRNQESKHITNLNILKEPPSMPMGPQACPRTQNNYSEMGKNEQDRRSFPFSSVQFMNLAHIFADF